VSSTTTTKPVQPTPPGPPWLPPIRAGDLDGRYINCTPDLGAYGDVIPAIQDVSYVIVRQDGRPLDATDIASAGNAWPDTIDTTGLILTLGFKVPLTNPGRVYQITFTVNKTAQGRVFVRDVMIQVTPKLG
jgi:hypothetical protein